MIRVPEEMASQAMDSQSPITVSICDSSRRIVLVGRRAGAQVPASQASRAVMQTGTVTNCSPWVAEKEGGLEITLTSGMDGLRGSVQVAKTEDGFLTAGAWVSGRLEGPCSDGGQSDASMLLGWVLPDESPDDPLLEGCTTSVE
jgi:hypothetical protein